MVFNESEGKQESSKKFKTFQKKKNVMKSRYAGRADGTFRLLLAFFAEKT